MHVQENVSLGLIFSVSHFLVAGNSLGATVGASVSFSIISSDFCLYFSCSANGLTNWQLQGSILVFAHGFEFSV